MKWSDIDETGIDVVRSTRYIHEPHSTPITYRGCTRRLIVSGSTQFEGEGVNVLAILSG